MSAAGCAGKGESWRLPLTPKVSETIEQDEFEGTLVKHERAHHSPARFQLASSTSPSPMHSDFVDLLREESSVASDHHATSQHVETIGSPVTRNVRELPTRFDDLSESDMLAIALSRSEVLRPLGLRVLENPAAATTVFDNSIAASDPFFGPQAALAEFDSQLTASLNAQNNDRVFNNATLGGDVQELVQDFASLNAGIQRRTTTGAQLQLGTIHNYDGNNRTGNRFPNYWETQWEAGVRQPLLQGAGRNFNLIAGPNAQPGFNFSNGILIARLNNRVSEAEFQISVRDFIRDLYSVYWDLRRQYATLHSQVESEQLAHRTWQSVLAKARSGLAGGESNKEAQSRAEYLGYRRQVQVSLGGPSGLYATERRLRYLMGMEMDCHEVLRPIDQPPAAELTFDSQSLVARAMASRTELNRQSIKVRQEELRLIAAKNFLLPQLDVIGRYRLRGFGDDLTGDGERFASAYRDFFSLDHQEWEFGVEMGVAAGMRQARAAVRNASLKVNRERSVLAQQQQAVRHEVADARARVANSFEAMSISEEQVVASRERLAASEAQFAADKIQLEFLLDAQEQLLRAESQWYADQTDYALALIGVSVASGSLLSDVGIHIHDTACQARLVYSGGLSSPSNAQPGAPVTDL